MKILLYTDNHFSSYSSILRSRSDRFSTRLENQIQSINWAESLVKEYGCEKVIHLGDFFDKPDLSSEELTALKYINWSNVDHYFIVGNHEINSNDSYYNSLNALSKIGKIISKPEILSIFGCDIILLPYIVGIDKPSIEDVLQNLCKNTFSTQEVKNTIILSHNDISGIRYGQYESKIGFNIKDIDNHCDLFINGHLHNQQQVSNKILNLGNLTGQNFSEDAEKYSHCAAILDTDTLEINLINNPYALNFYKFEILNKDDLYKLDKCKDYSVLSIKTYQNLINDLKQYISQRNNIVSYRIITIPELKENNSQNINQILKLDHIEQFREYILKNIDNTDLLINELSFIK